MVDATARSSCLVRLALRRSRDGKQLNLPELSAGVAMRRMGTNVEEDRVLSTIVANRIRSIATIMADTMVRTSRSPIFQARDLATAIFDANGQLIALRDYNPTLAGSLPSAFAGIHERFGTEAGDGDIYLLNDPFLGNNHPPDLTIMKPVFYQGQLLFWTLSKGHNADVGGGGIMGYNPENIDCWEDALRIPPVRLYRAGEYQRDIWEIILLNIRLREIVEGDIHCQIGAVEVGAKELQAMVGKLGPTVIGRAIEGHLRATHEHMASEIRRMRPGVYKSKRLIDNGGANHRTPIAVKLTATISEREIVLDFSDSDPQVPGFVNSTYANTAAACAVGIFGAVDPELRINAGSISAIRVVTKPGTVADAIAPAATTLNTVVCAETIIEAVWLILAEALPERTNAGWSRCLIVASEGIDERTGMPFVAFPSSGIGGSGATFGYDGWDGLGTAADMGGSQIPDPELSELGCPFTFLKIAFDVDSAGAGQWRGGVGASIHWCANQDNLKLVCIGSGAIAETAPFGLFGGGAAQPARVTVIRSSGQLEVLAPNSTVILNRGDVIATKDSGGGGYGNPLLRDIDAVINDVANHVVSAHEAEHTYGVIVRNGTGAATKSRVDQGRAP